MFDIKPERGIVRAVRCFQDGGHVHCGISFHLFEQTLEIVAFLLPELHLRHWAGVVSRQQLRIGVLVSRRQL